MEVTALRNIDEGEQIFISYDQLCEDPLASWDQRNKILAEWYFECRCPRCVADKP